MYWHSKNVEVTKLTEKFVTETVGIFERNSFTTLFVLSLIYQVETSWKEICIYKIYNVLFIRSAIQTLIH